MKIQRGKERREVKGEAGRRGTEMDREETTEEISKRSANRESRGSLRLAESLEISRGRAVGKSTRQGKTEPTAWGERKRETGWTQAKAGVKREGRTKAGSWKQGNEEEAWKSVVLETVSG